MQDNRKQAGKLTQQGFRYFFVGALTALFELILFQLLFCYTSFGVVCANIIAVLCATSFNFLMNRSFTFKSTSKPLRSAILYLLLFTFNMFFSSAVITLIVSLGGPSLVAKVSTMLCAVSWNFILYRKVIFK